MNILIASQTDPERQSAIRSVEVVVSASNSQTGSRSNQARKVIVTAIAITIMANATLSIMSENSAQLKDPAYGDKWVALRRQLAARPKEPLVLALGSSRTLLGFNGTLAEREIKRNFGHSAIVFNFGTPAAGPVTQLIYLRRLLLEGVKPTILFIEIMPGLCADGPNGPAEQLTLTGERLYASEVNTVEQFGFAPDRVRRAWRESAYLPLSKLRFQLLGRVVPSWMPWNLRFDWSRGADASGWATPPRQEITLDERVEREANARNEYAASLANLSPEGRPIGAIREILDECKRHRIETYLILYPEGSSFRGMYPKGGGEPFITSIQQLATEYRNPIIDARDWLQDSEMYDGHHMFSAGAEVMTSRLATEFISPGLLRVK